VSAALPVWLARLSQREQRVLLFGAIAAVILLIIAVVLPLQRSVHAGAQRIESKRNDLTWLRSMAPQLRGGLPSTHTVAPLRESLVVLVDRTARDAGIGKSLVGSQPSGDGGLNVRFEEAPFDAMIGWLSQLGERYGVHADSATIDAAKTTGTVNATLVLHAR
jgi:type II secretory pathway component PulM